MEDFGDDVFVVAVGTLEVLHPRRHCKRLNALPRIQKHDQGGIGALFNIESQEGDVTCEDVDHSRELEDEARAPGRSAPPWKRSARMSYNLSQRLIFN